MFSSARSSASFYTAAVTSVSFFCPWPAFSLNNRLPSSPCLQEKLYNPFYTLVLARLLSLHTHKFTLQYCLWDFLRDLGEGEVGGADHVRASKEGGGFSKNRVPERQVRNLARAYAWCVAKEGVTLSIFKAGSLSARFE